jgi:hypothetical protein
MIVCQDVARMIVVPPGARTVAPMNVVERCSRDPIHPDRVTRIVVMKALNSMDSNRKETPQVRIWIGAKLHDLRMQIVEGTVDRDSRRAVADAVVVEAVV